MNIIAIYTGIFFTLAIFLDSIISISYLKSIGVLIQKFNIHLNEIPKLNFTKGGIRFSMGWLPLGGYIKFAGYNPSLEENKFIPQDQLYYNKTSIQKYLGINLGTLSLLILGGCLFFISLGSVDSIVFFLDNVFKFSIGQINKEEFTSNWQHISPSVNIICLSSGIIILLFSISNILQRIKAKRRVINIIKTMLIFVYLIFLLYFILWKMVFGVNTFSEFILIVINFYAAAIISALVLHGLIYLAFPGNRANLQPNYSN